MAEDQVGTGIVGEVVQFHSSECIPTPDDVPLSSILPSAPRLLMGAGPVPVPLEVSTANAVVINHLGETMAMVIDRVKEMARYVFQTRSRYILGVAGPASAAMEMAITNLLWPGRKILCIRNGVFSGRFAEMAKRVGATCYVMDVPVGMTADASEIESLIHRYGVDVVTLVQGETSCTTWNYSLEQITRTARRLNVLTIVDAVCTLSTMPLQMDRWNIDVVVTGGQKGLSSVPGVSLIAFSPFAWRAIEQRGRPMVHWCLDALLAFEFWERKGYHYTAPVSGVLALHEALRMICKETLEQRFLRHRISSLSLQAAVQAMGLNLLVEGGARLNAVVGIRIPEEISIPVLIARMAKNYGVEISSAFGLNAVRIGQMGEQCRYEHTSQALRALGLALRDLGFPSDIDAAAESFESSLYGTRLRPDVSLVGM